MERNGQATFTEVVHRLNQPRTHGGVHRPERIWRSLQIYLWGVSARDITQACRQRTAEVVAGEAYQVERIAGLLEEHRTGGCQFRDDANRRDE
jgi:hypothetical protein